MATNLQYAVHPGLNLGKHGKKKNSKILTVDIYFDRDDKEVRVAATKSDWCKDK